MLTARDIMTPSAQCIRENDSLEQAAQMMRDLDVGALPICGEDNRLKGMLTDRDIAVLAVAEGRNPETVNAGEFGKEKPVTIGADDSIDNAIATMKEYKVRRLPVIDGKDLVGMVAQADIARHISDDKVGDLVELISN
ncbi:MAG: CBS domain-containing protein [Yaniella sp.]|uniref:CBS domain-containing protein n=1 Tax=Yaniella sp. TaxID=2773929 RepID=UPI002649AC97|nr:CBS domain-containing protein [Yaniella sp.]MDN5731395.1 CBS domain-containing protein [Yaniella sp.]MDN5742262.1 CBS domain-containing protein [Yaniella sp.]MDN5815310.1 CBS domain-containing protein [Yaniella sp.]MDN5817946.1 CBS domain-containing protein [Yaniella sp.]MDN5838213.1 CBS domain-containing protein [Yaniella sp.]